MSLRCPVCNSESAFERRAASIDLWRCPSCDHCFSDISTVGEPEDYSPEYIEMTHRNWFQNPNLKLFENIRQIIAHYKPKASVIDVGCGNGAFLKYIRNKNAEFSLTGIDLSMNQPVKGITFIQGDVLVSDFDRQYDFVVSLAVIEHAIDVQMFIRRLHSLCAHDGFVVVMTLNERSTLYDVARLLHNLGYKTPCERLYSKHHLNHFNTSSLKRLVEMNNLPVMKTLLHNIPLAAVDFPVSSHLARVVLLAGVWGTFMLGRLTGRTYLQTVVCQRTGK